MIADNGTLTTAIDQFLLTFQLGRKDLFPHAWGLLGMTVTLEILLASLWWALNGSEVLGALIKKLLTIGFFVFVIQNYDSLLHAIIEGFIYTGKTAATSSAAFTSVRDPSSIVSAGFVVALPILDHLRSFSSWEVLFHLADLLISGICALGVLAAYFIIAIQVFVTYLEFGMVSTLGLIFIPFGAFKHTAFLAEKLFGAIISFGVKLMVLGFLVSVTVPLLKSFTLPPDPTWTQLFNLLVACLAVSALSWHAPGVAAGLLAGGPALTANTAAGTAVAGAAAFESGARLSGMASQTPSVFNSTVGSVAKAAAVTPGIAAAGFMVGNAKASEKGHGLMGRSASAVGGSLGALISQPVKMVSTPLRTAASQGKSGFETGQHKVPGYLALHAKKAASEGQGNNSNANGVNKEHGPFEKKASDQNTSTNNTRKGSSAFNFRNPMPPVEQPKNSLEVALKEKEGK